MLSKRTQTTLLRLVTGLGILLLVMVLSACGPEDNPVAPDFSEANWQEEYDDILLVGDFNQKNGVDLITTNYPLELTAEFNAIAATCNDPAYDIYEDRWHTTILTSALSNGASIGYKLNYSGKERSGVIRVPASPDVVLPIFSSGDYHFEWTISSAPDKYISRFSYTYQSYFGEVREQLEGTLLDHTLRSVDWGGTVVYPLQLELTALNYDDEGNGFIVVAGTSVTNGF